MANMKIVVWRHAQLLRLVSEARTSDQLGHFKMASETDLSLPPPHLILPDPVVPATDYDNYQFAFKETPEFLAEVKDRLTKNARPYVRQEPYGHKYAMATVEDQVTDAALRFLRNIGAVTLRSM